MAMLEQDFIDDEERHRSMSKILLKRRLQQRTLLERLTSEASVRAASAKN